MLNDGFEVQLAYDGDAGIEQAKSFQPEVIVTDYMMPRMDGLTMVRSLREDGMNVPIILTTAVPEEKFDDELRRQFDVYIGKPFTEADLLKALRDSMAGAAKPET